MKKIAIDKYEKEVDAWKLKNAEKMSNLNIEEADVFLKLESERIKKQYDFKFITEYQLVHGAFSGGIIAEETVEYNAKKDNN